MKSVAQTLAENPREFARSLLAILTLVAREGMEWSGDEIVFHDMRLTLPRGD